MMLNMLLACFGMAAGFLAVLSFFVFFLLLVIGIIGGNYDVIGHSFCFLISALVSLFIFLLLWFAVGYAAMKKPDTQYELETEESGVENTDETEINEVYESDKQENTDSLIIQYSPLFDSLIIQYVPLEEETGTEEEMESDTGTESVESDGESDSLIDVICFLMVLFVLYILFSPPDVPPELKDYQKNHEHHNDNHDKDEKVDNEDKKDKEDKEDKETPLATPAPDSPANPVEDIQDKQVREKLAEIMDLRDKIYQFMDENPKAAGASGYLESYYLPTAEKLAMEYLDMEKHGSMTEEEINACHLIKEALTEIVFFMDGLYGKLRDDKAGAVSFDASADIDVLRSLSLEDKLSEKMKELSEGNASDVTGTKG